MASKDGGGPILHVWRVGAAALVIALFGGIVGLSSRKRRGKVTAAEIMTMDDAAFGRFLYSTGLDAKVEAVMARRRRVAR